MATYEKTVTRSFTDDELQVQFRKDGGVQFQVIVPNESSGDWEGWATVLNASERAAVGNALQKLAAWKLAALGYTAA